jgi:hypothetical protein
MGASSLSDEQEIKLKKNIVKVKPRRYFEKRDF